MSARGARPPGTLSAEEFANFLEQNGMEVVGTELHVETPFVGNRVLRKLDIGVRRVPGGPIHGIEVKSGGASRDAFQRFVDDFINLRGSVGTGRIAGQRVESVTTVYLE